MTPKEAEAIASKVAHRIYDGASPFAVAADVVKALTAASAFKAEPTPALHRGVGEGPCVACGAEYPTVGPCPGVPAESTITKAQARVLWRAHAEDDPESVFDEAWAAVTGVKP